jgi:hypothetical protein
LLLVASAYHRLGFRGLRRVTFRTRGHEQRLTDERQRHVFREQRGLDDRRHDDGWRIHHQWRGCSQQRKRGRHHFQYGRHHHDQRQSDYDQC